MKEHGKKHGLMMILCCLIPVILLAFLPRLGINIGPFARLAPFAVFLLCPLMHFGMMFFMMKGKEGNNHCTENKGKNEI